MATEWWRLASVRQNPQASEEPTEVPPPNVPPFVAVERTAAADGKQDKEEA